MVFSSEKNVSLLLGLDLSKNTSPINNVVFIFFVKLHFGVNLVLNNRATSTVFQVIFPRAVNVVRFKVMME